MYILGFVGHIPSLLLLLLLFLFLVTLYKCKTIINSRVYKNRPPARFGPRAVVCQLLIYKMGGITRWDWGNQGGPPEEES